MKIENDLIMKVGSDGSFVVDEEATKENERRVFPEGPLSYIVKVDEALSNIKKSGAAREYYSSGVFPTIHGVTKSGGRR